MSILTTHSADLPPTLVAEMYIEAIRRLEASRNRDLAMHEDSVGALCGALCESLGITGERAQQLRIAAELHDIGKLAISDMLLDKPATLTPDERVVMSRHAQIGYDVLSGFGDPAFDLAAAVARGHHECFDGSGYPEGLSGDAIPFASRIVSLCDVYDALRADRPYRASLSHAQAVAVLTAREGRSSRAKFDPVVLNAFANCSDQILRLYEGC